MTRLYSGWEDERGMWEVDSTETFLQVKCDTALGVPDVPVKELLVRLSDLGLRKVRGNSA